MHVQTVLVDKSWLHNVWDCVLYERLQRRDNKVITILYDRFLIYSHTVNSWNCKFIIFEENWKKKIWKMIYLISQITFIFLTQIYYNMNFITWSSISSQDFPALWDQSLLTASGGLFFAAHKKMHICLQKLS